MDFTWDNVASRTVVPRLRAQGGAERWIMIGQPTGSTAEGE
jgi:hypothetical protein